MPTTHPGDLVERAYAAYHRHATEYSPDQPSDGHECEYDGKRYVVLRNSYRTLAVYRVHNDDRLWRLSDWPVALTEDDDQ